jgi:hypothetical protein
MGIKERVTDTARPFLEPGDVVEQAFRAGRRGGGLKVVHIIVGTQDSIVVLGTSPWSTRKATHLVTRLPKSTPVSLRFGTLCIGDLRYMVNGTSAHPQARRLVNTG